jgi:hypothetical protein
MRLANLIKIASPINDKPPQAGDLRIPGKESQRCQHKSAAKNGTR